MPQAKTVAIIGAGPIGLAAAAHALEQGLKPIVLEAGPEVGHAVRQWQHVQLFSPWEYNVDRASEWLLAATGWNSPDPKVYATGAELIERYLEPLATKTPLKEIVRTSSRMTAISRVGFDKLKSKGREAAPFELRYQNGRGPETLRADAIIDASGTWFSPNPAGANGLSAIGEIEAAARIAYGMPDVLGKERRRYAGKRVAVLGAGHSAIGALIDLTRLAADAPGTEAIWVLRGNNPAKAFGGGANDKLAARRIFRAIRSSLRLRQDQGRDAVQRVSYRRRGRSASPRGRIGLLWSPHHLKRTDCRHRLALRSCLAARAAHPAGPGNRMSAGARTSNRSKRA
jgi:cation diffusion facilitator CzcD-associated flavoprotein CzcO